MKANATALNETHPALRVLTQALLVVAFAFATALAAQVRVPIPGTVVPATLQTAVVLLAGLRLGSSKGALSQAIYVAAGAAGLPFFAGASGVVALFGPTGGYLVGFVLAAWAAGQMAPAIERTNRKFLASWLVAFAASLLILIPGVIQLKLFTGSSWAQAIMMGIVPFMIGDVLKVTLVAAAHAAIKPRALS